MLAKRRMTVSSIPTQHPEGRQPTIDELLLLSLQVANLNVFFRNASNQAVGYTSSQNGKMSAKLIAHLG
jgi:hypothetical protein